MLERSSAHGRLPGTLQYIHFSPHSHLEVMLITLASHHGMLRSLFIFQELWRHPATLNLQQVYTNNIHTMAETYGIEAACRTIVKVSILFLKMPSRKMIDCKLQEIDLL